MRTQIIARMIKTNVWRISFAFFLFSCSGSEPVEHHLIIAVASNMQIAMEEIATQFTSEHKIEIEIASGSSGVLTAQIRHGAPFHVFLSANLRYPKALESEGLTIGSLQTYAFGTLILWSLANLDLELGIGVLADDSVTNFAIANPEIAPYGIAAMQALENSRLLPLVRDKMVMGESIGQVNQYVSSNTVQVGLTSRSVLYSRNLLAKGNSKEIKRSLYQPIEQGIVILKKGAEHNLLAAQLFYEFMFSPVAREILNSHGYKSV